MKLLDTWAWIEYFKGSKKGLKIKKLIETNLVYTSSISFAEISKWFSQNNANVESAINEIKTNSIIVPLEEEILVEAGKNYVRIRKIKKDIGLIDVIIYTSALIHELNLITEDEDLLGLPYVEKIDLELINDDNP